MCSIVFDISPTHTNPCLHVPTPTILSQYRYLHLSSSRGSSDIGEGDEDPASSDTAKAPHPPALAVPVSSGKIIERCESLVLSGLLQKVKYLNSGSGGDVDASVSDADKGLGPGLGLSGSPVGPGGIGGGFGSSSQSGGGGLISLHCIGYMYAADGVPVLYGAAAGEARKRTARGGAGSDLPAPSVAEVREQLQQQLGKQQLSGNVTLPAFSSAYLAWLSNLPLQVSIRYVLLKSMPVLWVVGG